MAARIGGKLGSTDEGRNAANAGPPGRRVEGGTAGAARHRTGLPVGERFRARHFRKTRWREGVAERVERRYAVGRFEEVVPASSTYE